MMGTLGLLVWSGVVEESDGGGRVFAYVTVASLQLGEKLPSH